MMVFKKPKAFPYDMAIETIQELVNTLECASLSLHWIKESPPKDLQLETLEAYQHKAHLGEVLADVSEDLLVSKCGVEFLLWLWLHAPYEKQNKILHLYARATGKDEILLGTINKALSQEGLFQQPFLVEKTYEIVTTIEDTVKNIDANELLKEYALHNLKEDYVVIPVRMSRDEVCGGAQGWKFIRGNTERERITISLDALVGIALLYKNIPQAVCSFLPSTRETLMLYQIQGLRYEKADASGKFPVGNVRRIHGKGARGLFRLHWREFLVAYAEQIAVKYNFSQLGIRSGQYHLMTCTRYLDTKEVHFPRERALQVYDATAQQLDFVQRSDKNWYRTISKIR